jgi:hypothetical protein
VRRGLRRRRDQGVRDQDAVALAVATAVRAAEAGDFQVDAVNHELAEQTLDPALLGCGPRTGDDLGGRDGGNGRADARLTDEVDRLVTGEEGSSRSGARALDPVAQAIRVVGHGTLDTAQKIPRVLGQPLARDVLAADAQALEESGRLAGVLVDVVGDDGLADRGLARKADNQGKQDKHRDRPSLGGDPHSRFNRLMIANYRAS